MILLNLGMNAGTHGLAAAAQAYSQFQPQKNYTALSPQQMVYLMDKQKQQQAYSSATSTSVSSPAGAYSVSISRGPLVPGSPQHAATVNIPSPRTPSMHSPSSISRPTSRPPSTASRPSSTASRTSSVMQSSPAGIIPPSISSPRQVPIIPTSSQSQVSRSGEVDSPLDLSRPIIVQPLPQTALPRTDGNTSADDPLDLSSQSSNRKRKSDDSDDDIICVGVSMPPTAGAPPKLPRLAPVLNHTAAYIPSQVYQVHHAQTVTPHRLPTQCGIPHQRSGQAATGGAGGIAARYGVSQQQGLTQSQRTSYSSNTMMNNQHRPFISTTSTQPKSILEEYIEAYKSGQKYPPRPTTPVSAQRPSSAQRASGAQPPPNVPHPGSGVVKTPSQIATLQQRHQQLLHEAQTTYDIQVRKRQQTSATKQAQRSSSGPSTTPGTVAGQGSALGAAPKSASVASIVQTGPVPGLPDTSSARQSNMLKQHPELHNVQIQSGRMLNHNVVQRPGVVVENRNAQSTQGAPGAPGSTPSGGQVGSQQHKLTGKERITYMMASEPVPACATTNATAIQITQQPTFIGAPLMVPNPALSRYNSGVQTTTTTSTTTTNSVNEDMSTPGVLKTENQEEQKTNTQTANSAANGAQPQKHFTNTDTQTADLPGDQWHRPPFHRIGMPNKNIPVANVNPMPHKKCASPALHPKKQILFQTQTTSELPGQERLPVEVKPEVPSGAETNLHPTRVNQESIPLKPEYSSSGDVKVDMSGHHEQYISKIKERLMRRMHADGSCDSGQDVRHKHDGKGSHGNGSSSSLKHLKRKYTRSGPSKYTAPLMKKAAQAMKREHVPYHHSNHQQQQGSPQAQTHGKPVLSKTVLDLSDITGESVDEGEHYSRIRSPHKRLGHTQLKGPQAVSKRLHIQKLKEVRLPKQQKFLIKVKEEKEEADEEYGGETEVENSDESQVTI